MTASMDEERASLPPSPATEHEDDGQDVPVEKRVHEEQRREGEDAGIARGQSVQQVKRTEGAGQKTETTDEEVALDPGDPCRRP